MSLWQQSRDWFLGLDRRERLTVLIGGVATLLMLVYAGIVDPLLSTQARLEQRVQSDTALVSRLQSAVSEIESLRGAARSQSGAATNESLFGTVDRTARSTALGPAVKRMQPDGKDSVRIQLEGAPFDALVSWLGALQSDYGIHVDSVSVDRADAPGTVNAQIKLSRGS